MRIILLWSLVITFFSIPVVFSQDNACREFLDHPQQHQIFNTRMPEGFNLRLSEAMTDIRMRQAELSRILNFSNNSKISKVVLGQQIMVLHDVIITANVLGVSTWWLLTGEGDKKLNSEGILPLFTSDYNKKEFIQDFRTAFGLQMRKVMEIERLSGVTVARAISYDDAKISKVIVGEQEFMPDTVVDLIRFLGANPSSFLDYSVLIQASVLQTRFSETTAEAHKASTQISTTAEDLSNLDPNLLFEALRNQGWRIQEVSDPTIEGPGLIIRVTR